MEFCAGCHHIINDEYLLLVGNRSWHENCAQCSVCHCSLKDKCFLEEGELYCRDDYCKCFGEKCPGCGIGLCEGETVRRNGTKVFHLQCFACFICQRQLETGEDYDYNDDKDLILCRSHSTAACNVSHDSGNKEEIEEEEGKETEQKDVKEETDEYEKVTEDEEDDDKEDDGKSSTLEEVPKKKREPRTSIRPEQLEVLMAAYLLDRKPAKPKKEQLAQITGLSMRVIQVWFQNRRQKEGKRGRHEPAVTAARHTLKHNNYMNYNVERNIGSHEINYFYHPTFG